MLLFLEDIYFLILKYKITVYKDHRYLIYTLDGKNSKSKTTLMVPFLPRNIINLFIY